MKRASIFDRLQQRHSVSEPLEEPSVARCDYVSGRLRIIDGLALTAGGFIRSGDIPEPPTPELSSTLYGSDGCRLLMHPVSDTTSVNEPQLGRLDAKALRLHQLVQTVMAEALMMLEAVPKESAFDILLSAPVRSPEAASLIQERLSGAVADTQYGAYLGEIRLAEQQDPHAALAVGEQGGMPYVLWIGVDSLVNEGDIASMQYRDILVRSSRGDGLYPGEAVAVLLVQRLTAEVLEFNSGWRLDAGIRREHAPRAGRRDYDKRSALVELLGDLWPATQDDASSPAPSRLVVDAIGMPGRGVELGGAVIERWPGIDTIDDALGVDALVGWSGEATQVLLFVLAAAAIEPEGHAVVLALHAESHTQAWALRSYAVEVARRVEDHS
ncbi:hypothetical protein ACFO0U_12750 [Chromohalobacter sarecensis]|uniref:Uncharacterized protein n=1 Tax=Chromohalobacter sarecensis TaxID=245294 RepID=A0ABV9D3H3_9GAMM|nr:hypothetical protein [Chromohalobacter sarecensis]MCK0714562.1 hypothetical protein [Chromohalobacter sarecensis]